MNTIPKIGPVTEPQVERAFGMWCVRLPDRETELYGKKAYIRNHMSTDGKSMRLFHTKQQAKSWLEYYKELLVAREEFIKTKKEQEQNKTLQEVPSEPQVMEENNVDWPVPDDYDPSKVTGKMFTGQGVDEDVINEVVEDLERRTANNEEIGH